MADRGGGGGGIFGAGNGTPNSFYFIICLALLFTVKDLFLNQMSAPGDEGREGGRRSPSSGEDLLTPPDMSGPGSRLSAGKVTGPSMKFMFW